MEDAAAVAQREDPVLSKVRRSDERAGPERANHRRVVSPVREKARPLASRQKSLAPATVLGARISDASACMASWRFL